MKILSYILVLCLLAVNSYGQDEREKKIKPKRSDNFIRMKGVRLGTDISRPFQDLWTKGNRYGYEFSADMEFRPNTFVVFESGYEFMKVNTDFVDYSGKGSYSRIGADYNFLEAEDKNDKNILYAGLRYGFSLGRQQVDEYLIDTYWGQTTGKFPDEQFFAHWSEFLLGLKGEIFKNFYMGWTIRGKIRMNYKALDIPPVYFIPGYGKANKAFNLDFTYSVYYNIPWDFRKSSTGVEPKI